MSKIRSILVLAGCAIGIGVNFVSIFGATFSTFVKPIATEFDWTRTQVVAGYSIASATLAIASWPMGMLVDRVSPRRILLFGVPVWGAALASLALVPDNYPVFLLACAIVGIAAAGCFHVVYLSLLPGWFSRRFGLALGVAIAGSGLGSMFLPSLAQGVITAFDWRMAFAVLGLTAVAIAWPAVLLLLREHPSARRSSSNETSGEARLEGMSRKEAMRTFTLWRLTLCYFLVGVLAGGYIINLISILTDRGVGASDAAAFAGLFGISFLVSRLVCGYVLDLVDAGRLGSFIFALGVLGASLLLFPQPTAVTVIAILLIGVASGSESDIAIYVVRRVFGTRAFGALNGVIYSSLLSGVLTGPLIFTVAYDRGGSYLPAQYIVIAGAVLACVLHFGVTSRARARRPATLSATS